MGFDSFLLQSVQTTFCSLTIWHPELIISVTRQPQTVRGESSFSVLSACLKKKIRNNYAQRVIASMDVYTYFSLSTAEKPTRGATPQALSD